MNLRRIISALQRFVGKPIALRDAWEPVLTAAVLTAAFVFGAVAGGSVR
jgi:hypothetical protein